MFGIKSAKTYGQSPARQERTDHREAVLRFSGRTGLVATEESGGIIMSGMRGWKGIAREGEGERERVYVVCSRRDKMEVLMAKVMSD